MSNIFPYQFNNAFTSFPGTFSIEKINKDYHSNYDYLRIHFLEGQLLLKDLNQKKIFEENVAGIKAVIALKKKYLEETSPLDQKKVKFTNLIGLRENKYNLMVVNTDLENKLANKLVLKGLLHQAIRALFIGNERYLLTIKK